jgi:hypothetical protein
MPETPDFERIALAIMLRHRRDIDAADDDEGQAWIVEQLRQVWNARGAADIAKLEIALVPLVGAHSSVISIKHLDQALRQLDR